MGSLIGNAVTLDGDTIRVTFEGEGVADSTLARIVSINTQMDGGGEYSPLKQTTVSISCLVDGAELMRLCVSEQPVSVLIENVEKGNILFKGYVVPNSYNQALSGINDTITIECVDCLGYAKYIPYERGETFSVMPLASLFTNIAQVLGIYEVCIPNDARLVDATGNSTARYDLLTVSDNMFYKSVNPEGIDGKLLYEPVAMTCDEVLRMIAESLRLTWIQVGNILYLIDDVKIAASDGSVVYRRSNGFPFNAGSEHCIVEESFATTACNVSSLPRYNRVVINHEESGERAIQPSLFELMDKNGEIVEDGVYDDDGNRTEIVMYQRLTSRIYEIITNNGALLLGYKKYQPHIFLQREEYNEGWDSCLRILPRSDDQDLPVLRCRKAYCGAVSANRGRALKVNMDVEISITDTKAWPHNVYDFSSKGYQFSAFRFEFKSTNADGVRYFDAKTFKWQEESVKNIIYFANSDLYYYYGILDLKYNGEIPIYWNSDGSGTIEVTLYVNGSKTNSKAIYIKEFEVVECEYGLWAREYPNPATNIEVCGEWKLNKIQEVSLPIDNYYHMTERGFGNIINGVAYKEILVGGDRMIDRVWKQANLGDRLMWEMSLRDEANALSPLDAFTCAELWNGRKAMVGFSRDVINNQITVTLV